MSFIFNEALNRLTRGNLNTSATPIITLNSAVITENRCYMVLAKTTPSASSTNLQTIDQITGSPTVDLSGGSITSDGAEFVIRFNNPVFSSLLTPSVENVVGVVVGVKLSSGLNFNLDLPLIYSAFTQPYPTQTSGNPNLTITIPSTGLFRSRSF